MDENIRIEQGDHMWTHASLTHGSIINDAVNGSPVMPTGQYGGASAPIEATEHAPLDEFEEKR